MVYEFSSIERYEIPITSTCYGGYRFVWCCVGIGFGQLDIFYGPDSNIRVDDENMSIEFVIELLAAWKANFSG